jgi:hypothetical protein
MEKQPYDFIDNKAPEKREVNRKMAEAARKGELFGGNSNNSSSNNSSSDRDKTSRETSDKPPQSNRPFLVRVIDKLFKLFE